MTEKPIIWLLSVILLSGCVRSDEVSKEVSGELLPSGNWTVDGVKIGDSFEKVTALLGSGEKRPSDVTQPYQVYQFKGLRIGASKNAYVVKFDSDQKVSAIRGTVLLHDGRRAVSSRSDEKEVESILGVGYVKRTFQAKHTHISLESIPESTVYMYKDVNGNQLIVSIGHRGYNRTSIVMRVPPENQTERYEYSYNYWQ